MILPWNPTEVPLMLAPMQGLTNRAMRKVQQHLGQPDVVFTEFMRVRQQTHHRISRSDRRELSTLDFADKSDERLAAPLVVQLIGHSAESLAEAAQMVQDQGCSHVNINMGCPFGRTTSGRTGGAMLQAPELLPACVKAVRRVVHGSFSIKVRAGYDNPEQIFELLPMFEGEGVDFVVLHPRTVVQQYQGVADHLITSRAVAATTIPLIANGDVVTAEQGQNLLRKSGAAGLMLGRGVIADPFLFRRIRGIDAPDIDVVQRQRNLCLHLQQVKNEYTELFCGDQQVLAKLKAILSCVQDEALLPFVKQLLRCRDLQKFCARLLLVV